MSITPGKRLRILAQQSGTDIDSLNEKHYHFATVIASGTMYRVFSIVFFVFPALLLAQDAAFVPPLPTENAAAPAQTLLQDKIVIASRDSVLGDRIARISATLDKVPQEHGQIWREYDITPLTQERRLPTSTVPPEQALVDWILRKTGANVWHAAPFGILTADSEKLCVYHTREMQLLIADVVDRFVCPQLWNEACTLRIVSTSRPDWLSRVHSQLRPIKIATPGVQGWIL